MRKTRSIKLLVVAVSLLMLALLVAVMPAMAAGKDRTGDSLQRFTGSQNVLNKTIEKMGFFDGVKDNKVFLIEQDTYRKLSYLAAPGMLITKQGQAIDLLKIWPASIVKLIIVDAEVVEIILIQESS